MKALMLDFAGRELPFRLTLAGWREIQDRCNVGPPVLAQRLTMMVAPEGMKFADYFALGGGGSWRIDDVREPIFQGLVGGGMDSNEASRLVKQYVDAEPWLPKAPMALRIVMASLVGPEEIPPGEPAGGPPTSPTEN